MKLSQAKEYLPFVQAAAEGKTIQWADDFGYWCDYSLGDNCWFADGPSKYRIKPEPKLRAWRRGEQPIGKNIRHKQDHSQVSTLLAVCEQTSTSVCISGEVFNMENKVLLDRYEMEDGKPCGIEESV